MTDAERTAELEAEVRRLKDILNTPLYREFLQAVELEAAHQESRQDEYQDSQKTPRQWYWTAGYLVGKAMDAHDSGDPVKALHHCVSSAALLYHWHKAVLEQFADETAKLP